MRSDFGVLTAQRVTPAQQSFVCRHQRCVVRDCACRNKAIGGIGVQIFKFARENANFAGKRQFPYPGSKNFVALIGSRPRCTKPAFGDEHRDFPKADCTDEKPVVSLSPFDSLRASLPEFGIGREPTATCVSSTIT
ncbi:MAG TPA: hypothetical protein VHU22_01120 [Xanthobacteraceae bacterium]|nr:hypothetical protein [Xanthobacteraceae bacterium]